MPVRKLDPENLSATWSVQRVQKPQDKLFPGPQVGSQGDWRMQLFTGSDGSLYERHKMIVYEKAVERWFVVTNYEATIEKTPPVKAITGDSTSQKRTSKAERLAKQMDMAKTMCRRSLNVLFGELVDEIEFAMTEWLFGDQGQRLLRRIMKRVTDARNLTYDFKESPKAPAPTYSAPSVNFKSTIQ